jgi:uncharacterized FlaG/YvyC family protein
MQTRWIFGSQHFLHFSVKPENLIFTFVFVCAQIEFQLELVAVLAFLLCLLVWGLSRCGGLIWCSLVCICVCNHSRSQTGIYTNPATTNTLLHPKNKAAKAFKTIIMMRASNDDLESNNPSNTDDMSTHTGTSSPLHSTALLTHTSATRAGYSPLNVSNNNNNDFDNAPLSNSSSGSLNNNTSANSPGLLSKAYRWCLCAFWVFSLVMAIVAIAITFNTMHTQLQELQVNYVSLDTKYADLSLRYTELATNMDQLRTQDSNKQNQTLAIMDTKLASTNNQLVSLNKQVAAISNHSNAQVLPELQQTKAEMNTNLVNTQSHIETELNATLQRMNVVVTSAAQTIFSVQNNVTTDLNSLSAEIQNKIDSLNADVEVAQQSINEQVKTIQDQITTYIVVSDKQFAAENDFVRFQLAGTFTLIGCLISLWHINSHGRHYINPNVQVMREYE